MIANRFYFKDLGDFQTSMDKIAIGKFSILDGEISVYKSEQGSISTSHGVIMLLYESDYQN